MVERHGVSNCKTKPKPGSPTTLQRKEECNGNVGFDFLGFN